MTLRIDSKGRLTLPRDVREELELEPGDSVFYSREGNVLKIAKARNPFDVLGDEAIREHRAGMTRSLRDYARERGLAQVTSDRYSVELTRRAEKDLKRLRALERRAIEHLLGLEDDPHLGHALSGGLRGYRSLEFRGSLPPGLAPQEVAMVKGQEKPTKTNKPKVSTRAKQLKKTEKKAAKG